MKDIGSTRTFESLPGKWEIKEIARDKNILWSLTLNKIKCPKCEHEIGKPRNYMFNHIEKLECDGEIKYLGVSTCGRYIILDKYLSQDEIISKIGGN